MDALRAVQASMSDQGHAPNPPHRDGYSRRWLIVCRFCGARVRAECDPLDGTTEVTYDEATAVPCTAERHP